MTIVKYIVNSTYVITVRKYKQIFVTDQIIVNYTKTLSP